MARRGANRMPLSVRRRYFELIRQGLSGAEAARGVGGSLSYGFVSSPQPSQHAGRRVLVSGTTRGRAPKRPCT